MTDCSE